MLTVKEFVEQVGISLALGYSLVAHRRVRHERHGIGRGTIRIPLDAVDEYRKSRTVETEQPMAKKPPVAPKVFTHLDPTRLAEAWAQEKPD
jgi:hypothetical protein